MKNRIIIITIAACAVILLAVFLVKSIMLTGRTQNGTVSVPFGEEASLLARAQELEAKGELVKAREEYQKILDQFPGSNDLPKIQEALDNTNIKILFSPVVTEDSFLYEVKKGDNLTRIAKANGTTVELISKSNGITGSNIRVGKKLKVVKSKFSIVVDKSQNILTLKSGDNIIKTYKVSTGKDSCTPTGTFNVTNKIIDPPWYPEGGGVIQPGDPKNTLGSRWIGISKESYGIHGTIDPGSIGQSVTNGCVRMTNQDVEELFVIVPTGTEVVIVD